MLFLIEVLLQELYNGYSSCSEGTGNSTTANVTLESILKNIGIGIVDTGKSNIDGIKSSIENPLEAIGAFMKFQYEFGLGIPNGMINPELDEGGQEYRDAVMQAISQAIQNGYNEFINGNGNVKAYYISRVGSEIALVIIGDKATKAIKLGKSSEVTNLLSKEAALSVESKAIPMSVQLLGKGDDLTSVASKIKPLSGYTDIIVHGSEDAFWVKHNGDWVSVDQRSIATYLKKSADYNGGSIRLISCKTGELADGVAKNISNKLGVNVMAPTDTVWIYNNGNMTVGATAISNTGKWKVFSPGK